MEGGPVTSPGCFVDIIICVNDPKGVKKELPWEGNVLLHSQAMTLPQCVTPGCQGSCAILPNPECLVLDCSSDTVRAQGWAGSGLAG